MAQLNWATADALTSSLVTTELDSLADGSASSLFTHDNSTDKDRWCSVTILLGSITPTTGGSITLRVLPADGTNTPDNAGGELYVAELASGTGSKVVMIPSVQLYPFSMRFSVINNSGVTFNAASNDVYLRKYNEETV